MLQSNGWDRNTRTPAVVLPPNACDCAAHVYGRASALAASRTYEPPEASFEDLQRVHRTIGIERGVLVQPTTYGTDHAVLLEALAQAEGRYLATGIVDETVSDTELERLARAGVRGARFSFLSSLGLNWSRTRFERQLARIAPLGWIALVHASADELLEREEMLRKLRIPLVIDHMAQWPASRSREADKAFDLIRELLREGNTWIKLSNGDRYSLQGPAYDDMVEVAQAFIAAAPERAIWASDWPHVLYRAKTVPNDAELVELLFRYAPDSSVRDKILVDNPAALFGFPARINPA